MTKRQCDDILYHLNAMRKRGGRFNFLKQNCSYMATEMAEFAGVHIEHRLERARIFEYLLPHFSSFPPLNSFVKKVCALSERISRGTMLPSVGETVGAARSIIEWAIKPLDVVVTTICNLAMMSLGACSASPLKEGMYGNKPGEHMRSFYSVIQSAKDIFSNEPTTIYHSGPIIAWQQRQKSTHSTPYTVPIMNILPESSERGTSEKERPFLRFDTKM